MVHAEGTGGSLARGLSPTRERGRMTPRIVISIVPMGAVRQTRADAWRKRDCVLRYRAYRDELRRKARGFVVPECDYHLHFFLPIPESWSAKKKLASEGQPHQSKPDKDNLEKAFLDALLEEDSRIWDGRVTKRWSAKPRIEIELIGDCK